MEQDTVEFEELAQGFREDYDRIVGQVGRVIVGLEQVVEEVMICLLCGGHALLEGVPGLGKTLLVRTFAQAMDLQFSRIQFTPDLMPADIIGTNIVVTDESGSRAFQFQRGPIFGNIILADEINRATPKTQSAVLEAMQEQTVSVARRRYELPRPFFVLATQNPLEMEGTYPLPEAQLDRFMFKVHVPSPKLAELMAILDRTTGSEIPSAEKVVSGPRLEQMQQLVRQVLVASHVKEYIGRVVLATHPGSGWATESVNKFVRYGSSPRGAQAIILAAKALALREGRANISFADARRVVAASLRHRLILSFEGQAEGVEPDAIITQVVEALPEAEVA
ncbi:MAG: AAA family ATPase [Planctomycetes bacterium SM23_25]|nr:MAG: AAA family ATPase [Planctomycetes bacterium SM23_25]